MTSSNVHFDAIRFANTVLYDNDTVIYQNAIGVNTSIVNNDYIFSVNGNALVRGSVFACNLIYGISNLSNIVVEGIDMYQRGQNDFLQFQNHPLVINNQGNVGIGTTIAYKPLTLYGTLYTCNLSFSDGYDNTNEYFYVKPVREIYFVNDSNIETFRLDIPGSNVIDPDNVIVHFSGLKLSSSNAFFKDYSVSNIYKNDITECYVIFNRPAFPVNIVEIIISPDKPYQNYPVFSKQTVTFSPWDINTPNIYTYHNVGIGTLNATYELYNTKTTYASNLIVPNLTALDTIDESLVTQTATNANHAAISTLSFQGQPILTIFNDTLALNNATLRLGSNDISTTKFSSNIDLPLTTATFPQTANLGIGTTLPLKTVHVVGDVITVSFSNAIPSQWVGTSNIYYLDPTTVGPTPTYPQTLNIQGNAFTSNLTLNTLESQNNLLTIQGDAYMDTVDTFTGMVAYFAGSNAQPGWLACDGSYVAINTYPELYTVLGTLYGPLVGATFKLPDMRGEFIRGWDNSRGIDIGRSFGSSQGYAMQSHTHVFNHATTSLPIDNTINNTVTLTPAIVLNATSNVLNANAATETRARNIALLACIKT